MGSLHAFITPNASVFTVTRDSMHPNVRENSEQHAHSWDELERIRCLLNSQHCKEINKTILRMLLISRWVG